MLVKPNCRKFKSQQSWLAEVWMKCFFFFYFGPAQTLAVQRPAAGLKNLNKRGRWHTTSGENLRLFQRDWNRQLWLSQGNKKQTLKRGMLACARQRTVNSTRIAARSDHFQKPWTAPTWWDPIKRVSECTQGGSFQISTTSIISAHYRQKQMLPGGTRMK